MRSNNKRREKNKKEIDTYPRWLICCEGKSEVIYLKNLVEQLSKKYGIHHNIQFGIKEQCEGDLYGECKRQHMSLIDKADICQRMINAEETLVVFDEDAKGENKKEQKKNFKEAILYAENMDYLNAYWSSPSLEYWFAIHGNDYISGADDSKLKEKTIALIKDNYKETHCSDNKLGNCNNGSCNGKVTCKKALDKPYFNSFNCLGGFDALERAIKNGEKSVRDNKCNDKYDFKNMICCTNMHELVKKLRKYFEDIEKSRKGDND